MSANGHVPNGPEMAIMSSEPEESNARVGHRDLKILTVEEAIPYSPFSSIVPFDFDIIPTPSIGLRSSISIFQGLNSREDTQYSLNNLNREAADSKNNSDNLLRSLNYLRELLHPAGITRYKFKIGPKFSPRPEEPEEPQVSLSAFSQIVFDNTSVAFTNPAPDHCSKVKSRFISKRLNLPAPESTPSVPKSHLLVSQPVNRQQNLSFGDTSALKASEVVTSENFSETPLKASTDPVFNPHFLNLKQSQPIQLEKKHTDLVVNYVNNDSHLSNLSNSGKTNHTNSPHSKTSPNPEPKSPKDTGSPNTLLGTQSKLPETRETEIKNSFKESPNLLLDQSEEQTHPVAHAYNRRYDEREKADIAFRNLQEYLQDIFDAENQLEATLNRQFFTTNSNGGAHLTMKTHVKLDTLLQKVVQLGRFSKIEVDDLMRIQRLCETTLKDTECLNLKVDENMDEDDIRPWLLRLTDAELGIRSARTALRIMAGGRDERQVYSEDITQSTLNALSNVVETSLIPIVEMRSSGSPGIFRLLSTEKKSIFSILKHCQKLLLLMANLVTEIELSDSVVNALECIVSRLFFVENASTEKDSVIGISKFDGLRTAAMEVLSGIFATKPAQRRGIFAEFLTSLEKLPVSKQSARQFKLAEGGNIQHASALIMRLIQISTMKPDENKEKRRLQILNDILPSEIKTSNIQHTVTNCETTSEMNVKKKPELTIDELRAVANPLMKAAKSDATYVIEFIVARATTNAKGTESPFRHLLDLFIQDFITCLGSLDWPAAELLLRLLLFKMIEISKSTKASSTARNMALDMLSQMGPKISELHFHALKMVKSVEYCQSELGSSLAKMVEQFFEKRISETERQTFESQILSWSCGPFHVCIESLQDRSAEKFALNPAISFIKVDWANRLCESFDHMENKDEIVKEYGDLAFKLREMIDDDKWLIREYSFDNEHAPAEIRLAHTLILLGSPFCHYLDHILSIFLTSMNSGQAMVQAKSLKCLTQLLDTDPGTIDRHPWVKDQMVARLEDVSSSVRENALGLISKLISLRPSLESDMVPEVLKRLSDANVSVRKRAIKLAKEIYTRNYNHAIRIRIAKTILWKTGDDEITIQELARQTVEEIWFAPLYLSAATREISPQFKLGRAELVSLMVETIETPDRMMDRLLADRLDKVLTYILSSASKYHEANSIVCKALIENMIETVIDNSSGTSNSAHSRIGCFHILQVFATSRPKLFTTEHIQILHPYIANLSSTDNAAIYNSVVNIFKHTLSHLSSIQENLLISIRNDLLKSLARLRVTQLDDVIACMSIISGTLQNFDNLTRVLLSALETIKKLKRSELSEDSLKKLFKLLPIIGLLGKHCDFDSRRAVLSEKFPVLRHDTVPKLITDTIAPLASPPYSLDLRKTALQAIGYVCFSWPKNFSYVNVYTSFEQVFEEKQAELEIVVLEAFKVFLIAEEKRSGEAEITTRTNSGSTAKLGIMGGGQGDGIALGIAQRFLQKIISVALSSKDEKITFISTEIIASVARQGLVHPKQPGVALITLGTTKWIKIAKLASEEHTDLHTKHETLFERDYMTAVQSSYDYQRDIVEDTRGAWLDAGTEISGTNYISKLSRMVQVLNDLSKPKTRKKFFENLCLQLDRNKPRKDATEKPLNARGEEDHISFSQYIVENIAYFEYKTIDELVSTIHFIEKFVSSVGTEVSHAIEQEIFMRPHEQLSLPDFESEDLKNAIRATDLVRLRQLTAASIPLLLLWEARTYLRHQYNIITNKREGKVKILKDLTLKPSRIASVNGDKFWRESNVISNALELEDTMISQCRKFVELLNFDHEFKVAACEDDENFDSRVTPEMDDENSLPGTPRPSGSSNTRKRKPTHNPVTPNHKKHCRPKILTNTTSVNVSDSEF